MGARSTAVTVAVACLLPAASSASAAASTLSSGSLWAGGRAYLAMDLGAPASSCQLVASGPRRTRQILSAVRPNETRVKWIWTVPLRARTARWRVLAICGASRLSAAFVVHGKERSLTSGKQNGSVLALARQVRVVQSGGSFPAAAAAAPAAAPAPASPAGPTAVSAPQPADVREQAKAWWARTAPAILALFHTGIAAGQCTDYVAAKRPDVIQRVDTWAYGRFLMAHGGDLGIDWTAKNWLINAQTANMSTGRVPEAGAVMVFQPGAYGAFSAGHVAIVSSVHSDGSFTISETHAPVVGQLTARNFSAATALAMVSDPQIGFIYQR